MGGSRASQGDPPRRLPKPRARAYLAISKPPGGSHESKTSLQPDQQEAGRGTSTLSGSRTAWSGTSDYPRVRVRPPVWLWSPLVTGRYAGEEADP